MNMIWMFLWISLWLFLHMCELRNSHQLHPCMARLICATPAVVLDSSVLFSAHFVRIPCEVPSRLPKRQLLRPRLAAVCNRRMPVASRTPLMPWTPVCTRLQQPPAACSSLWWIPESSRQMHQDGVLVGVAGQCQKFWSCLIVLLWNYWANIFVIKLLTLRSSKHLLLCQCGSRNSQPFELFQRQAESNWAADDDTPKTAVAAVSPGVNGTTCSAYPACVDVGIKDARGIGSVSAKWHQMTLSSCPCLFFPVHSWLFLYSLSLLLFFLVFPFLSFLSFCSLLSFCFFLFSLFLSFFQFSVFLPVPPLSPFPLFIFLSLLLSLSPSFLFFLILSFLSVFYLFFLSLKQNGLIRDKCELSYSSWWCASSWAGMHGYFVISVFLKIGRTTNHDLLIMNGVIQEQCGLAPRRRVCSLSAFTFSWPDPCFTHLDTRWRTARAISSLCMSLLSMGLQSKWFLFFEVSTWSLGISDHTCVCSQSARCDGWPNGNYLTDSTSLLVSSADPCQLWPSQHLGYPSNWASHVRVWAQSTSWNSMSTRWIRCRSRRETAAPMPTMSSWAAAMVFQRPSSRWGGFRGVSWWDHLKHGCFPNDFRGLV